MSSGAASVFNTTHENSAAIMPALFTALPHDRSKRPLKKCIVHHVAFLVFTVDNPISRMNLSFSCVGKNLLRGNTPGRFHKQRSTGSEGFHLYSHPPLFAASLIEAGIP
jgi:hypothetical protein